MKSDSFGRELALARKARAFLTEADLAPGAREMLETLLKGYDKLLRQSGRLLSMGDRMQAQLSALNADIAAKEARYRSLFSSAAEGIFRTRPGGGFAEVNPAMARIFGYGTPEDFAQNLSTMRELFAEISEWDRYAFLLKKDGGVQGFDTEMLRRGGERVWVQLSVQKLDIAQAGEGAANYVGVVLDVTEQRRLLMDLSFLANTDALTGLANRRRFMDIARHELARGRRNGGSISLCLLDVDYFKRVNDSFGHDVGDAALASIASVMSACVREVDLCARIGGEEFVVLLPDSDQRDVAVVAERIRAAVEDSRLAHDTGELSLTVSIGTTTWPECGHEGQSGALDVDGLIKHGDIALYAAKKKGRNRVEAYVGPRCDVETASSGGDGL